MGNDGETADHVLWIKNTLDPEIKAQVAPSADPEEERHRQKLRTNLRKQGAVAWWSHSSHERARLKGEIPCLTG